MPLIKIQTNVQSDQETCEVLLKHASRILSEKLGKPIQYVQAVLEPGVPMAFGGETSPTAFMEIRGLGLPSEAHVPVMAALSTVLKDLLAVEPDRVFANFTSLERSDWGWNGKTFV